MTDRKNSPRTDWRGGFAAERSAGLRIAEAEVRIVLSGARDTVWGLRRIRRGDRRIARMRCHFARADPVSVAADLRSGRGQTWMTGLCDPLPMFWQGWWRLHFSTSSNTSGTLRAVLRSVTQTVMPAPSISRSMADGAPIRLLLLNGPMANGGRMKPAGRTFFPGLRPSSRMTLRVQKSAPRRSSAALRPNGSCGPRPPWPVPRQQGDGRPATANRRLKDGTGTWICDED